MKPLTKKDLENFNEEFIPKKDVEKLVNKFLFELHADYALNLGKTKKETSETMKKYFNRHFTEITVLWIPEAEVFQIVI